MIARVYLTRLPSGATPRAPKMIGESFFLGPDGTVLISDRTGREIRDRYVAGRVREVSAGGLHVEAMEERATSLRRVEMFVSTEVTP